jgi:hypothetical protein
MPHSVLTKAGAELRLNEHLDYEGKLGRGRALIRIPIGPNHGASHTPRTDMSHPGVASAERPRRRRTSAFVGNATKTVEG